MIVDSHVENLLRSIFFTSETATSPRKKIEKISLSDCKRYCDVVMTILCETSWSFILYFVKIDAVAVTVTFRKSLVNDAMKVLLKLNIIFQTVIAGRKGRP